MPLKIGTAGWAIGRAAAEHFPSEGSGLERYSSVFSVTEINSSFHRPHRASTWIRWRNAVPDDFRFSVKVPKEISHRRKLVDCGQPLAEFLEQVVHLEEKLAVLLLQLPPKLEFDAAVAEEFFGLLASSTGAAIACEPRNPTWFGSEASGLLHRMKIARVTADPACTPAAQSPGGWRGMRYWRLHGSPVLYRSSYAERIAGYADQLAREEQPNRQVWCIFDNTASSAAISDALLLQAAAARAG